MPEAPGQKPKAFPAEVERREKRKLRARRKKSGDAWVGLGLFGVVGWAVAIPTVVGIFAGLWIDLKWPGPPSWTLMLLLLGIIVGCANAWFWVSRQRRNITREREDDVE
jgi:ATP synthase protein I